MADQQLPDNAETNRDAPLQVDEQFRQLVSDHHEIDERIRRLSNLAHLTADQEFEEMSLKKQKLALKDRMEAMIRDGHAARSF